MKKSGAMLTALVLLVVLVACAPTNAPQVFTATLSGASEVPPVTTAATGTVTATLNGNTLTITGTYSGLSGAATAAHIHGPAEVGQNAPPVITLTAQNGTISGTSTELTALFVRNDLVNGRYYVNIHTAANPGGEIRGQLAQQ